MLAVTKLSGERSPRCRHDGGRVSIEMLPELRRRRSEGLSCVLKYLVWRPFRVIYSGGHACL
jgi:hypothetical protein